MAILRLSFFVRFFSIFIEISIPMLDKTTMRAKWRLDSEIEEMFKGHRKLSHVQDALKPAVFPGRTCKDCGVSRKSQGPCRWTQGTDTEGTQAIYNQESRQQIEIIREMYSHILCLFCG